ncbi:MAG: nuclear transport factor 2 family protein [Candidatus Binataceae bacterium]
MSGTTANDPKAAAARIYELWDDALGKKNLDAAMRLYAEDATLESPLVRHLLGTPAGIVEGRDSLRKFVEQVFQHQPKLRRRYRTGFFTDGTKLMWEYPRVTPDGEQMDFVEVMELKDGLIHHHRVYWGWRGLKTLEQNPD